MGALRQRVITVGGGQTITRNSIAQQIDITSKEHIARQLQAVVNGVVNRQLRMGNTPTSVSVDGSSFKTINQAQKRVIVLFGQRLARTLIVAVEHALAKAISGSTKVRTGDLRNIRKSWEWVYVPGFNSDKRKAGVIVDPSELTSFNFTDRLILRPKLGYATIVNQRVRSGGSLKQEGKRKPKIGRPMGFLGYAATMLRRTQVYKDFSIYAAFSSKFLAPGEVTQRTGMLIVRPRRRGRLS